MTPSPDDFRVSAGIRKQSIYSPLLSTEAARAVLQKLPCRAAR